MDWIDCRVLVLRLLKGSLRLRKILPGCLYSRRRGIPRGRLQPSCCQCGGYHIFVETNILCSGRNNFNIASIIPIVITITIAGHPSSSSSQGPALSLVRPDCPFTRSGSQLPIYKIERQISQIHIFSAGSSEPQCRARSDPSGDTNNGHMMLTKLLRNKLEIFLRSPCHFLELGLYTARNNLF